MISHLYRFRPIERLLAKNELQNQEVFFAKPENLNDPMEGFRDVFWKGDEMRCWIIHPTRRGRRPTTSMERGDATSLFGPLSYTPVFGVASK
jgi:hypothetical protein